MRVRGRLVALEPSSSAAAGIRVREVELSEPAPPAERTAAALRAALNVRADDFPGAELVPGLAVGDTSLVSETLSSQMRASGLTHLVAVSGANCALVTGGVGQLAAWLRLGRRTRITVQAGSLLLFVIVVGPEPSVYRAAAMATVILLSRFGGRRAISLPALGVAVLVLLVRDPWQALHPGFVLSVVATLAILLAATPVAGVLRHRVRLPGWVALPVAVALVAQLACAPFLILLQPEISAVAVLANVLAAPAAPVGTGLGLLALLMLPLSTPLGTLLLSLATLPARWVMGTAAVSAGLPLARLPWPAGWPGAVFLAASESLLLLGCVLAVRSSVRRPHRRAPWRDPPKPRASTRRASAMLVGVGMGALVAPTLLVPAVCRLAVPQDWSVVVCDVGQGDAILIRNPSAPREVMLVDTGDDPAALRACLDRFGVRSLAWLVLSHDHRDHIGALREVLDRTEQALIAPPNQEDGEQRSLVAELVAARVPLTMLWDGDLGGDAVRWRALGPRRGITPPDANGASVVLQVYAGELTVLLTGDTGRAAQRALLTGHGVPDAKATACAALVGAVRADVLKVAHHGSRDQHPCIAAAASAELAVISVGAGNRYGHPAGETLRQLESAGTAVWRTDTAGTLALSGEPGRIVVWAEYPDGKPEQP
ncbi:ComEC/Rec2 family competence protein [Leucobacter chromiireducens subsp. chromiireducens]|uniref:ComEC/Rec2 family competence protein n=1 Tax=Leucobacter chromiireducens subsp. chromiireducens TaxID=660067 RepID=A0ABS1SSP1_9MICO|nr:ComEC/Rec2 family competence protein [Leucobacter chromiireducens]MBL3690940.1 ComEC/Rec2 family competence protein [Leucobacter chromiireducens subsp. chromiireducens]